MKVLIHHSRNLVGDGLPVDSPLVGLIKDIVEEETSLPVKVAVKEKMARIENDCMCVDIATSDLIVKLVESGVKYDGYISLVKGTRGANLVGGFYLIPQDTEELLEFVSILAETEYLRHILPHTTATATATATNDSNEGESR